MQNWTRILAAKPVHQEIIYMPNKHTTWPFMTAVDFLHHENPPTWAGVEPTTLSADGQRQTNYATQSALAELDYTGMWVRLGSTDLMAGKVMFLRSNQGDRLDGNESVADSFRSDLVGFKSWSATILGAFLPSYVCQKKPPVGKRTRYPRNFVLIFLNMPRTRQSDPLLTQTASEKFNLIDLIPMYDGGESLGIRRFLEKINDVANLGKWSNAKKVTILKLKLAGIADEFFLSDPTHSHLTEYNDIARVLIARFEKAVPLSTRLQLFSSCIQGSSESVQEFAARINKLGTQIFQSGNSAQNMQIRFGTRPQYSRRISAALIEEQNVKLNQIANDERSGLSPSQTGTSVISALTNKLQEINLRVERLQEVSSVTVRKTGGDLFRRRETVFKCFYCGFQGHRQAECRKKRMDERRANYQSPRRNVASEFSVFRHPSTHSSDRRHVHFQESAFRDNYAAPRHLANGSQTRDRGGNGNLNFRGESRF
ncbi:hypothetical protein TNCV_1590861 [Trichonephila clavipes]|nr:hypothetical protein TNCV_1590861 [Trichonephila clavipes]